MEGRNRMGEGNNERSDVAIRKWYNVYTIFKGRATLNCREGYKDNMHGVYINLFLTEDEADKIRNIEFDLWYLKRSPYLAKDHMKHEIYKVLPELFEE